MICSQCGTENQAGDKFCEQCGAPLSAPADDIGPGVAQGFDSGFGATVMAGPAAPSVLIRLDENGEQEFPLGSRAVVGRLDTCDVPINDKSVSREHARLSRLRDGYVIEDLGSTNGTLVNGRRIDEAVILHTGDIVTIGSIDFRFDVEGNNSVQEGAGSWGTQAMPSPPSWEFPAGAPGERALDTWRTAQSEPAEESEVSQPGEQHEQASEHAVNFPPLEPFAAATPPQQPFPPPSREEPPPVQTAEAAPAPVQPVEAAPAVPEPPLSEQHEPPAASAVNASLSSDRVEPPAVSEPPAATPFATSLPRVDDTTEMAEQLTGLIQDLARQLRETRSERDALQQRIPALEEAGNVRSAVRQSLQNLPPRSISPADVQSIQDLLSSLNRAPRDLDLLTQVASRASALAAVVNDYVQLQQMVDTIAGQVGLRPAE